MSRQQILRWGVSLLGAGALAGGAFLLRQVDEPVPGGRFLPCLFHELTGWHCPGCGMTRATRALLRGDAATAWAMNPIFPLIFALVFLAIFLPWLRWVAPRQSHRLQRRVPRVPRGAPLLLLVFLLAFGVLRNLPWSPFSGWAPDEPDNTPDPPAKRLAVPRPFF